MEDLYALIYGITLLVLLTILLVGFFWLELKANQKRKDYINKLNDHDCAVIHDYLTCTKLTISDFKKKKRGLNNEDK